MTHVTHDVRTNAAPTRDRQTWNGFAFALASAITFGLSGSVARGLLDTGWSAGAVTVARMALGAVTLAPFGLMAMRGRWHLLTPKNSVTTAVYGVFAVAAVQFCFFSAIQYMHVGPALLIEFTAPAVVVLWLWVRHGQRPRALTLTGVAVAFGGLVLVVDLLSGAAVNLTGVLWALGAMAGVTVYFVLSAEQEDGLPSLALASGGLVVGTVVLGLLGWVGLLPMAMATDPAQYAGFTIAWWIPVATLGVVSAAFAYFTGIAAIRRLGSRLASFAGLLEVVAAFGFAWLLIAELPGLMQLTGGVLIVAGVATVKLGERTTSEVQPAEPHEPPAPTLAD